ncbi:MULTISPECIES: hypothetical protein [Clostridium]|jgi:hypothetical protein|uniref:Uncharacterized protein n=2 Tax=root TaxID=1 RepID=A0A644VNT2_9ZZZZ|nr:hypothetical protein [Clostridium sp. C8]KLE15221.1 hypothetical protein AAT22_11925 [Clostridium sp. C8]
MKSNKKLLTIIFIVIIFLLSAKISAYANTSNNFESMGLNSENFIEYINNLSIDKEDIENIIDKGKDLAEDVKDKTSIKEFSLAEILGIYKDATYIANNLNLNIDFSFKDGNFILKEKENNDTIFEGNINELGKYFDFYKNNLDLLAKEVLGSIDNKEIIENIEEVAEDELGILKETSNNNEIISNKIIDNKDTLNDTKNESENNSLTASKEKIVLENNKRKSEIIFSIFILSGAFFTIAISYIKLKK